MYVYTINSHEKHPMKETLFCPKSGHNEVQYQILDRIVHLWLQCKYQRVSASMGEYEWVWLNEWV